MTAPTPWTIEADLEETVSGVTRYILRSADYGRSDRLWPAHYLVFVTNPLNVAFGACGTALFLHETSKTLPPEVASWLIERPVSVETYPPGLCVGLAGVAHSFLTLGFAEKAEETMSMAYRSRLLFEEPSLYLGVAGWGIASLHFFLHTGRQVYLDHAVHAGEHLIRTAQHDGRTCYWRCQRDGLVHYGFGYGASGIALFLLYLHAVTGIDRYRGYAKSALDYDIANQVQSEVGLHWKRFEGDTIVYPYFIRGSAGIGATLIRFSRLTGDERYTALAHKVAEDTFIKYSFVPSLFEGLSGIGELMMDMFWITGKEVYRQRALEIAETVLWFKVRRPEGIAFPGAWLTRISNDYATGAAGIGLFLHRILHPGRRLFADLDFGNGV